MSNEHPVTENDCLTTKEMSEKWNVDYNVIASWCRDGYVSGAEKETSFPWRWRIPRNAERPLDVQVIFELLWQIVELQNGCIARVDLSAWGIPIEDNESCITSLLINGYLVHADESSPIRISNRGLRLLGRNGRIHDNSDSPLVLKWSAEMGGRFVGSILSHLV